MVFARLNCGTTIRSLLELLASCLYCYWENGKQTLHAVTQQKWTVSVVKGFGNINMIWDNMRIQIAQTGILLRK